jgi:tRNA pseudouridine55 synthase
MYSALRQGGRRLHELARAGVEVDRAPRRIRFDRVELVSFAPPRAGFAVACSKGTYVRSLVRDVGEALGCGATLVALRRTAAGPFTLAGALPLADVTPETAAARMWDPARAVEHLPTVHLDPPGVRSVQAGRPLEIPSGIDPTRAGPIRLLTPAGKLAAVAEIREGLLRTLRVFNYGLTGGHR